MSRNHCRFFWLRTAVSGMVGFNNFMIVFFLIGARICLMVILNACTELGRECFHKMPHLKEEQIFENGV